MHSLATTFPRSIRPILLLISLAMALFLLVTPLIPQYVSAAPCQLGQTPDKDKCTLTIPKANCDPALGSACGGSAAPTCSSTCIIDRYVNPLINFLAIIVGLVVTITIVVGGIQYSSSASDPQKVAAAKTRITNGILALLAFLFLWIFLQWLIPGGFL